MRLTTKHLLAAAGATSAVVAVSALTAAYYFVDALTRPMPTDDPSLDYTFTPWELDLPFEEITFASTDGHHILRGWWIAHPTTRSVIIASSGYRRNKSDLLGIGKWLFNAGHSLFLIDYYGHGTHYGAPVTLGFSEVNDLLGAVDEAVRRAPGVSIGTIGFSMGASVSIMAAARDERIRAVVADSAFASHRDLARDHVARYIPIPNSPLVPLMDPLLGWRAGYRFQHVEPVREVGRISPRPLLLIHGTADTTTPPAHSRRLREDAGDPVALWLVEGAGHCGAYFVDRLEYCRRVTAFFADALGIAAISPSLRSARALD